MTEKISLIIPALNEAGSLAVLLPEIRKNYPEFEVIVVDDGSTDDTAAIAGQNGATVISHPYTKGNGAAVKSGANAATGNIYIFMDADGQHSPESISALLDKYKQGYDMVVGARKMDSHAGKPRFLANWLYNKLASWVTGHKIPDLTSGFRLIKAKHFLEFIYLLPNGFSYPTTITMAMFRSGYSVGYVPVKMPGRSGDSHIKPVRDGIRFLLIIFKVATLYAPLKLFFPISALFFLTGLFYYIYTFIISGRFTNMGLLMLMVSVLIFLIGLISEQLTVLLFVNSKKKNQE